jgi:SAM-dependent methyltransferase
MSIVDGYPVIYWTIKRLTEIIPALRVIIVAPSFDRGGELDFLVNSFPSSDVSVYYGHDASPLNRMLEVCSDMEDKEYIIRVDGLHFCFDVHACLKMLDLAKKGFFDCIKLPDDFPVQFTSDIYRIGALRKLDKLLVNEEEAIFRVHPKFFMFQQKDIFRCNFLQEVPLYSSDYLQQCRDFAKSIYFVARQEVNERGIWSGNQLSFHYELALGHLQPHMKVLDVACGDGYGTRMLARKVAECYGADIDVETISVAKRMTIPSESIHFYAEDVTQMSFSNDFFDAVTSMETVEHVDGHSYMREVFRVLKPGGVLILSTPQNSMGAIPVNAQHIREYSLNELIDLCSQYFNIQTIIGIKAGRIIIPGDPKGLNTMIICSK